MEQSSDEFLSTRKQTYEESEPVSVTRTFCSILFASRPSSASNTTSAFCKEVLDNFVHMMTYFVLLSFIPGQLDK
jgi:hypothetical protein